MATKHCRPPPKRRSRLTSSTWYLCLSKAFGRHRLSRSRGNLPPKHGRCGERRLHNICRVRNWRPLACVRDCHGWRRLQPPGVRLHGRVSPAGGHAVRPLTVKTRRHMAIRKGRFSNLLEDQRSSLKLVIPWERSLRKFFPGIFATEVVRGSPESRR